jgi:hypothetical protein
MESNLLLTLLFFPYLFGFARIPCGLSKIPDFERGRRDDPSSLKAMTGQDGEANHGEAR